MSGSVRSDLYPPQVFPSGELQANKEVQQWFRAIDQDNSGQITWKELQKALVNAQGRRFSDNACKMLIAMCDHNNTETIDIYEFQHLFSYVKQWTEMFQSIDRDSSGFIEVGELERAFRHMGYNLSFGFVSFLMGQFSKRKMKMSMDEFIVACIQIQRLTEAFRVKDREMKGVISVGFEEFLYMTINSITI